MKVSVIAAAAALLHTTTAAPVEERASSVQGFDISAYQAADPGFAKAYASGARFVIIKVCARLLNGSALA